MQRITSVLDGMFDFHLFLVEELEQRKEKLNRSVYQI